MIYRGDLKRLKTAFVLVRTLGTTAAKNQLIKATDILIHPPVRHQLSRNQEAQINTTLVVRRYTDPILNVKTLTAFQEKPLEPVYRHSRNRGNSCSDSSNKSPATSTFQVHPRRALRQRNPPPQRSLRPSHLCCSRPGRLNHPPPLLSAKSSQTRPFLPVIYFTSPKQKYEQKIRQLCISERNCRDREHYRETFTVDSLRIYHRTTLRAFFCSWTLSVCE